MDALLEYCEPTHSYTGLKIRNFNLFLATATRILAIACLSLNSANAGSQSAESELFSATDKIRAAAESDGVPLLSPTAWSRAIKEYEAAKRYTGNDRTLERITRRLSKADEYFEQAVANAERALPVMQPAIDARRGAEAARAQRFAEQFWAAGERRLEEAARAFEKENISAAKESAAMAETEFRQAELSAIKTRTFSSARSLIAEAELRHAERLAPRSLAKARRSLREADALLTEDRYQTETPKLLADQAARGARHTIYIAKLANKVSSGRVPVENLLLDWEAALTEIAEAAGFEADLTEGYSETTGRISKSLRELRELPEELAERDRQIKGLEEELRELDAQLGGASAERLRLVRRLEEQARIREQFNRVGDLFTPDEAKVLRDGNEIIVRLVGLSFASNSAELGPEAADLMGTVNTAIDLFPNCDVTVEGHTDSSGNADRNLELSNERAKSVVEYMIEEMRIPEHRITAVGYGDARPITSNKTLDGRAKNRRIDLIISPKLAE